MIRRTFLAGVAALALALPAGAAEQKGVKVLIITGDAVGAHNWKATTAYLKEILTKAGMKVDVTETPGKDLSAANLAKYDVYVLNYKDTKTGAPASRWSEENQKAFAEAVKGGKGLVVLHHASAAFTSGGAFDKEFERIIAGGWRKQGYHGRPHPFTITIAKADHPITKGLPHSFRHNKDELYQNSLMFPDNEVLATAYSDKSIDNRNTGKNEPILWVSHYGKGRVVEDLLGHDVSAMKDPGFKTLLIRSVEWAATGHADYPVPADLKEAPSKK